ncbi:DUF2817 domain-containing protein [Sessilibacter corallicola]|uniref:DUF2817 domain-containing protein n=1 Tax=Sessilibacter corallicola TaxID=2904075 RepID=UPI001E60A8C1|nr:DUF2817 domain-containing protein [Sessilibacter corallicola]MCE2028843.1 DUF2817 domain-containing protein [Sessilibacter corallicola]
MNPSAFLNSVPKPCVPSEPGSVRIPERSRSAKRLLQLNLPELLTLEQMIAKPNDSVHWRVEHQIPLTEEIQLPIYSVNVGNADKTNPAILFTAGMHGVERIGTQVIIGFLQALLERLEWDKNYQMLFERLSLTVVPILNPSGMYLRTRANKNGVDLNRNSPVDVPFIDRQRPHWLAGGQTMTSRLPWYRGNTDQLEPENVTLRNLVQRNLSGRPASISLDVHSGFGFYDRIWFPYAHCRTPWSCLSETMALKLLWQRSCPHHNYQFEPQSSQYLTHGDIWDYLHLEMGDDDLFLPLTLELGSWNWVRKRPSQLFRRLGLFHPMVPHRLRRAVRDHQMLLQFLLSAAASYESWLPNDHNRDSLWQSAVNLWYQDLL